MPVLTSSQYSYSPLTICFQKAVLNHEVSSMQAGVANASARACVMRLWKWISEKAWPGLKFPAIWYKGNQLFKIPCICRFGSLRSHFLLAIYIWNRSGGSSWPLHFSSRLASFSEREAKVKQPLRCISLIFNYMHTFPIKVHYRWSKSWQWAGSVRSYHRLKDLKIIKNGKG